jgi:hypothetical protein
VLENRQRKAIAAEKMYAELTNNMHEALMIERSTGYGIAPEEIPQWL